MDLTRWERVQSIFHGAAALSGPDLESFLDTSCGGDLALRGEVESLLSADARPSTVLDGGVADVASRVLGQSTALPGQIGPYRVQDLLGEGGMGVVYRATRADLGRSVALKVLRDAWLSPARRLRFEAERRILAGLEHPSIARLYDADVLPNGTPWFAMELVDGVPLTEWCARRGSSLRERLALFRAACEAVAFAHRHAVVHRDIKPSNLLVGSGGALKLLDFGIAKQLAPGEAGAEATRTGLRLMTPAYAAPEQLRGEHPGLHTDVWALGAVLYELLAGRMPFDPKGRSSIELETAILGDDPARPSAVARKAGGCAASRAEWQDLDVLCLTALQKDPRRRYPSAEALLRDLGRFLQGRPLDARPDSARYRLRKFVGRHRWQVMAASLAVAAIAGTAFFYAARLARARDAALAEAARAQHVQTFLQDLLQGGDKEAGPAAELKVLTLLDRGAKEAATLASEPSTQADLFATLGLMYGRLGQLERADALLQRALDQHRALRGPGDASVVGDLVALGRHRLDQSRAEEAERLVREAVALARRALPQSHPAIADALVALGAVLNERGQLDASVAALQEAIALRSRPGVPPLDLAGALAQLTDTQLAAGRYPEAEPLNERALEIFRSQLGERHPRVAERLFMYTAIRGFTGRGGDADIAAAWQGLEMLREWYGADHPRTARGQNDLGVILAGVKRFKEADQLLRGALATQERLYGKSHQAVGSTLHALGMVAAYEERYVEAASLCRRAGEIFRAVYGERHPLHASGLICEARALLLSGREPVKAEALTRKALAIFTAALPPDHRDVAITEGRLGLALLQQRRFAEALPHTRAALELLAKEYGPRGELVVEQRGHLAAIHIALGNSEEAAQLQAEQDALRAGPGASGRASP